MSVLVSVVTPCNNTTYYSCHVWCVHIYYIQPKRVEDDFLGELAQLVNLDSLTNPSVQQPKSSFGPSPSNPFGTGSSMPPKSNPFEASKTTAPTLNQLAEANKPPSMQSREFVGFFGIQCLFNTILLISTTFSSTHWCLHYMLRA